jgi:hypothetical protein
MPATLATNVVPNASQHSNRAASVVLVAVIEVVVTVVVLEMDVVVAVAVVVLAVVVELVLNAQSVKVPSWRASMAWFKYMAALQSPDSSLINPDPLHPKMPSGKSTSPRVMEVTAALSDATASKHTEAAVWITNSPLLTSALQSKLTSAALHFQANWDNRAMVVSHRKVFACETYVSPKTEAH